MLLAHISDIHFRFPECNGSMDPDRAYRTLLIRDLRERAQILGNVDAILVTGDIAYHGYPEEYTAAREWLIQLAEAGGINLEAVFVVPGNHDVDHRVINGDASVRNVQGAIAGARTEKREQELRTQFMDSGASRSLLLPIQAYNDFAKEFECQLFPPEQLFWRQTIKLSNDISLCIHGLSSTLLSGAGAARGEPDSRISLYLSPLQTALDPGDNIVNLVMCHHPPDWFLDQDDVEDAMRGRALVPGGHPNSPTCGHPKLLHPERA